MWFYFLCFTEALGQRLVTQEDGFFYTKVEVKI